MTLPQAIINKQILKDCDLLVGVFWTRIGTATGQFASGTVEEIEEHIKTEKPAMLYFSAAPVVPDSIELDQYQQLQTFKKSCQSRGLYESYADLNDFRTKLYRHLQLKLNRDPYFQQSSGSEAPTEPTDLQAVAALSKEAAYLLQECAADPSATIMNVFYIGGQALQVQGKNLIEDGSDRSRAIWTSALSELESLGYVEPMSAHDIVGWISKEAGFTKDFVESTPTVFLERELQKLLFVQLWDKLNEKQRNEVLAKLDPSRSAKDNSAIATPGGASAIAALSTTVAFACGDSKHRSKVALQTLRQRLLLAPHLQFGIKTSVPICY